MTHQPESTGITVRGTELSEEETAALLAVVNTQLIETGPTQPPADHATRNRVTTTWAGVESWHNLPQGH